VGEALGEFDDLREEARAAAGADEPALVPADPPVSTPDPLPVEPPPAPERRPTRLGKPPAGG
jgi:hypothetical protein